MSRRRRPAVMLPPGERARNQAFGSRWRKVRRVVLERDGYLCQIRLPGCTRVATVVDHIRPWQETGPTFDPRLLQASCAPCNRRKGSLTLGEIAQLREQLQEKRPREQRRPS